MKKNHFFNLFVLLAVTAIVALTVREALAMSAVIPQADRSNDSIEHLRATRSIQADRSYDPIELLRVDRLHPIYFNDSGASSSSGYCISVGERLTIRSVYMQGARSWFPRTPNGPTGVDGGLIQVLSGSRSCSG
ncbi:MAG TPA: hypothetical protein VIV15_05170 [Anaerolineales bacterium]